MDELAEEYLKTTKDAIAHYRIKYSRKKLLLRIGIVIASNSHFSDRGMKLMSKTQSDL